MNKISIYLLKQLAIGLVIVTVGLTSILLLTQSLRLVELIVSRGASAWDFFRLLFFLSPNLLLIVIPVALFSVVIFTYHRLINDKELVVMQASGINLINLAKPALALAVAITVGGYALSLYLMPAGFQEFRDLEWKIKHSVAHIFIREGTFTNLKKGLTVYVRERSGRGELSDILIHDSTDSGKPSTVIAERAALVSTPRGPQVVLFNGNRQEHNRETNALSILYFDQYTLELGGIETPSQRYKKPREYFFDELTNLGPQAKEQKNYPKLVVEIHRRILEPLFVLSLTFLGLAVMLTGQVGRRGMLKRILAAIGIATMFITGYLGLPNLAASNLAFTPLMYLNTFLPIALGLAVLAGHPWLMRQRLLRRIGFA